MLREGKELAGSGSAITLGNGLDFFFFFLNSRKLFGAKSSNLGNISNLAKLGMFSINLHKTNHLVGFIVWS